VSIFDHFTTVTAALAKHEQKALLQGKYIITCSAKAHSVIPLRIED